MQFRIIFTVFSLALLFSRFESHSMMTEPEGIIPKVCRMGGIPNAQFCSGPCDTKALSEGWANFDSPQNPAATYKRGEKVIIKYQRNNHGPGGFVRHTLVPVDLMMSKEAHTRNAFHYSCFGAHQKKATKRELEMKRPYGFSIVGNDGAGRDYATGYYYEEVVIPRVIPDGKYVLGWVWYGGTGGKPIDGKRPKDWKPWWKGYFGDYWSCSFVEIKGGMQTEEWDVVFENDMSEYSDVGCMSAADAPGVCVGEPCVRYGKYQAPRGFVDASPPALTKDMFEVLTVDDKFGGGEEKKWKVPKNNPPDFGSTKRVKKDIEFRRRRRACACLMVGDKCSKWVARKTAGRCEWGKEAMEQPKKCRASCCKLCDEGLLETAKICIRRRVREICWPDVPDYAEA